MVKNWLVVVGVCVACRSTAETRPPEPEPAPEAAPGPADTENTYVSGKPASDAPVEEAKVEEASEEAAAAGVAAKVETIAAARTLVGETVDGILGANIERLVAPALVPEWPTKERVLVFVVFPLEASKQGINTFIVGVPIQVTVDLVEGTVKHQKLRRSAVVETLKLGRDAATVRANLATAEQTLIEVLLERRPVERSLMLLDGYREWFNHHLEIFTDLDKRLPSAVRWLRQPTVDGHTAG